MKKRIVKYSQSFSCSRENYNDPASILGCSKPKVSLYDDFECPYISRPDLHDVMCLPDLE